MNENHTRITVTLSKNEWDALRTRASAEYRNPRDEARYLLRNILLTERSTQKLQPQPKPSQTAAASPMTP